MQEVATCFRPSRQIVTPPQSGKRRQQRSNKTAKALLPLQNHASSRHDQLKFRVQSARQRRETTLVFCPPTFFSNSNCAMSLRDWSEHPVPVSIEKRADRLPLPLLFCDSVPTVARVAFLSRFDVRQSKTRSNTLLIGSPFKQNSGLGHGHDHDHGVEA